MEKPAPERDISDMRVPAPVAAHEGLPAGEERYLASMGIYVFSMPALRKALDNTLADFGAEVIPAAISTMHVGSYVFGGYWEDIGTIRSFYEANLDLASINPDFNLYLEETPIYTGRRNLPPSKINFSTIAQSLAAEGSIITNATINHCIVGIRTIIETGATLDGVVCMGADYYETAAQQRGQPRRRACRTWASAAAPSCAGRSSTRTPASARTAGSASTTGTGPTRTRRTGRSAAASS